MFLLNKTNFKIWISNIMIIMSTHINRHCRATFTVEFIIIFFRLQCGTDRRDKVVTQCDALLNVTIPGFLGDSSCSIFEPGTYPSPQLASSSLSLKTSSKSEFQSVNHEKCFKPKLDYRPRPSTLFEKTDQFLSFGLDKKKLTETDLIDV